MEAIIREQLKPSLWYIGLEDTELRAFRSAAFTDAGVVYSSYLIDTGDGWLLIGVPPVKYTEAWLNAVTELTGTAGPRWAAVYGEPGDRSAVKALLEKNPQLIVIGGTVPLFNLKAGLEKMPKAYEIRSGRNLALGNHHFSFTVLTDIRETPSLYITDETEQALFTADVFGCLASVGAAKTSELTGASRKAELVRGIRRYQADIGGKAREKTVQRALALVEEKKPAILCPAYGPAADAALEEYISYCVSQKTEKCGMRTVAIVTASESFVPELAEQILAGIRERDGDADAQPVETVSVNVSESGTAAAAEAVKNADFVLFGTEERDGDVSRNLWEIAAYLTRSECKGKAAAVYGCGAQDGAFTESFTERLAKLGFELTAPKHILQGAPDESALKAAYEYGFDISCIVRREANPRAPKLVKCLVCGEIFDASLGTCPVCGVGLELCVPVTEDTAAYHNNTECRYVILGGGVAAVSAAEAIRRRDETGAIEMYSAEPGLPINRPMLTKDFRTVAEAPETLVIHPAEWYEERSIALYPETRAERIDRENKTVYLKNSAGETITVSYDKLIYATGAECFVPPFKGKEKPGVLTIRHLADSAELAERMKNAKQAVVIGGGVLGLEAASEIQRQGLKVTILEATPQIVGRQIDAASAAVLKAKLEAMHAEVYEGVSIQEIEGETEATGVRLADGRVFPADVVVVSCGNRGNVGPAQAAGLETARALVVDCHMQTSDPDIYAAGDCCQYEGVNFQLWAEASGQGKVAGANAAGEPVTYQTQDLGLSLEGFGISLYAQGDPGKKEGIRYRTVVTEDAVDGSRETYWFEGGVLQGAVVIGRPDKTPAVTAWVSTHARHSEIF